MNFKFISLIITNALLCASSSFNKRDLEPLRGQGDITYYGEGGTDPAPTGPEGGSPGACALTPRNKDYFAALNYVQYGVYPNPNNSVVCGRCVKLVHGSKSVVVEIVDKCPICPSGDVDIAPTAFKELFGSLDVGRVHNVQWHEVSCDELGKSNTSTPPSQAPPAPAPPVQAPAPAPGPNINNPNNIDFNNNKDNKNIVSNGNNWNLEIGNNNNNNNNNKVTTKTIPPPTTTKTIPGHNIPKTVSKPIAVKTIPPPTKTKTVPTSYTTINRTRNQNNAAPTVIVPPKAVDPTPTAVAPPKAIDPKATPTAITIVTSTVITAVFTVPITTVITDFSAAPTNIPSKPISNNSGTYQCLAN